MIRWKCLNVIYQTWTLICFCCLIRRTCTLTVDNELVSARNDCFERVALEAMIPFEKTFKTEDTNSLRMCKERCLQEGDKCQSMSFGVHRRGNGTCQLSKEKYKIGSRPSGVIFDPDFDLYVRKTNCFDLSDNNLPNHSDNLEQTNGYGSNLAPTPPVLLSNKPSEATTILLVESSPSVMTTLKEETTRYISPTAGYGEGDHTTIFTQGPPTTYEPSKENVPSTSANNGDRLYFSHDIYPLYKYPTLYEPNYPAPNQEVYIPGGYAAHAQEVEDRYPPTSYDSNVRPSPATNYYGPPKPIFGLGYSTGYGYGQAESYNPTTITPHDLGYSSNSQTSINTNRDSQRPAGYDNSNRDPYRLASYDNDNRVRDPLRPAGSDSATPSSPYFPRPDNSPNSLSANANSPSNEHKSPPYNEHESPPAYGSSTSNDHNSPADYESRPENLPNSAPTYGSPRPSSQRPADFTDFTYRPDAPDFDNHYMRRNGTAASRPAIGFTDDKHINTYFNPDDYLMGNKKKRPGSYEDNNRPGYNRGPMKIIKED